MISFAKELVKMSFKGQEYGTASIQISNRVRTGNPQGSLARWRVIRPTRQASSEGFSQTGAYLCNDNDDNYDWKRISQTKEEE